MRIPPSLFDIPSRPLADAFNIRYSTKYYDAESDLYYYGYRYYAPGLHRWLTRDPIAEEGGVNLYGFCENASVFKYDSDGLLSYVIDVGVSKFSGDVFLDQSQEKFEDQFALLKQVLDSVYISCRQTTRRQDAAENRGIASYCIDSVARGNSTDTVTYARNGLVKTKITGCDLDIYPIRIRRMVDGAIVN